MGRESCLLSNQRKTFKNKEINLHLKRKLLKILTWSPIVWLLITYLDLQASETAKDVHDGPSKIDLKSFQKEHSL